MYRYNCIKYYDLYIPFIFGPLFTLSGGYPQRDESLIPFFDQAMQLENGCFSGPEAAQNMVTPGGFRSEGSGNEGFWT